MKMKSCDPPPPRLLPFLLFVLPLSRVRSLSLVRALSLARALSRARSLSRVFSLSRSNTTKYRVYYVEEKRGIELCDV